MLIASNEEKKIRTARADLFYAKALPLKNT